MNVFLVGNGHVVDVPPDLWQTLFLWANAAIIIGLLSWLLYKPVLKFLEARRERIASEIEEAQKNLTYSLEQKKLYEGKLAGIETERSDILSLARRQALEREQEIIEDANREAGLILERARIELEREREKAKDEIRTQIVEVGTLMAERFVGEYLDPATKDRLLEKAIADLGDAQWTK